ncbi:diaminopimelate decarboxylase [Paenisporosarcina quisquiliarum]|uniref:Diaminopimelate decarboxylase n=1 Tax=Paenisporosarcina quisquiliarum TaxID=365346 RepID=A0A9X3LDC1_9BACL|nr:diaminopimelate decarboxylase [Paenisporosarcina quisquiliarum]MCZ8535737.1 diaminopimelate decarboxylase [Paenisporosarcina quisquiliarum]
MHLFGTQSVDEQGHLTIGGTSALTLAKNYGTPLYVYDTALIKERALAFIQTFEREHVKAQVAYASKAFSSIAMYQLAAEEGLSLDVVSGGELYTAIHAGFPVDRIHFHGNNKSDDELLFALNAGIGCIVVDNFYEIEQLKRLTENHNKQINILLRVTPGIEAHTHDYITTGQADSKFGFDLNNGQADKAFHAVRDEKFIRLLGMHCHIGSQIFDTVAFSLAAKKLIGKMLTWKTDFGFICPVLNLGGGFGIRYTEEDKPLQPAIYVEDMIRSIRSEIGEADYPMPEIWIEPGRSLVGDAGTTLYSIGSQKEVPGVRNYLAVDGGMSDNIRPALYQAKYDAAVANKMTAEATTTYTVAGKCCESGDKLIEDISLPSVEAGDILAVFCTGAYGYSMASNYNRLPRPAVVFVEEGSHRVVIKRETYEDLVRLDCSLQGETVGAHS